MAKLVSSPLVLFAQAFFLSFSMFASGLLQSQTDQSDGLYHLMQVNENLYQAGVRNGGHTTVVLITPDGVVIGDPISESFSEWLKAELRARFNTQVKYVIYSHHHPDHASGGLVFADTATFIGHKNMNLSQLPSNFAPSDTNGNGTIERTEVTGRTLANFNRIDVDGSGELSAEEINAPIQKLDITYDDQMSVRLGDYKVEIYHMPPAHADDMSVILFPEHKTLFAVDFLQVNRFPGGLSGFLGGYTVSDYTHAIDAAVSLDFDLVIQGHSDLVGSKTDAAEFKNLLLTTESRVTEAVATGKTLEETLEAVTLAEYSGWLLYETRREALVADMYRWISQQ